MGRKVGDVMERTKCGAEGWRRQSVGLKVGDEWKEQSGGTKVGDVMERTKCGAEGWRRDGKNKVVGRRLAT